MPVEDAACRGCGSIPEMVRGAWWPHAPGAPCGYSTSLDLKRPLGPQRDAERARHARLDGRRLCNQDAHAFQVGSRTCDCGAERLDDAAAEAVAEAAFDLDEAERRGDTACGDGLHVFPNGGGRCHCGADYLAVAPSTPKPSPPWYLQP